MSHINIKLKLIFFLFLSLSLFAQKEITLSDAVLKKDGLIFIQKIYLIYNGKKPKIITVISKILV